MIINFKKILSYFLVAAISVSSCVCFAEDAEWNFIPFIDGYSDNTFRPEDPVTRAEAVKSIACALGINGGVLCSFSDVTADEWYYDSVCALCDKGYLDFFGDKFYPDIYIKRGELANLIFMMKYGKNENLSSEDMFGELIKKGIIKGDGNGYYGTDDPVTRAEAVALINRELGATVSVKGLNKYAFKDVSGEHWAFADILYASKRGRMKISYPENPPEDYATKVFDKYNEKGSEWQKISMTNDSLRAKGVTIGGEGGQRMNSIAISSDGSFLLCGNDVASIHRSIDGGKTWEMCNRGFYSKSGHVFAIDPNNTDRCVAYGGAHFAVTETNGIYLSTDRGFSWKQKLSQSYNAGQLELRESIAYDASSYDENIGGSAIIYWSKNYWLRTPVGRYATESEIPGKDEPNEKKGLWKSTDGGETWFVVNSEMTDGIVKVNPENGTVYVSNLDGFFRSTDGGKTFKHILKGSIIYGLDVIASKPNNVYLNDYKGVLVSEDSGKTFKRIATTTFPKSLDITSPYKCVSSLKVSPVNPNNMVVAYNEGFGAYKCAKYYSNDGGKTWNASQEKDDKDFFKKNNREAMFVWSPTDANKVWSFGGDWIVSSNDAGKSYVWDYEGGAAVFVDQRTIFNIYNPDIFYYGSQDFHGAMTTDGGKNWKHIWKISSGQGAGNAYGTYAADEDTLIAFEAKERNGDIILKVSRDGGETFKETDAVIKPGERIHRKKWAQFCYQSPTNPDVLFAANYRSDDYGYTWNKMDIDLVMTHNPYGKKELYGTVDQHIVVSYDDGATWQPFCDAKVPDMYADTPEKTEIWDMTYDGINNILYYVSGNNGSGKFLVKVQNGVQTDISENRVVTPLGGNIQLCAVDPRYPNVLYIGGYGGDRLDGAGIQRSVDGGESFQVISTVDNDETIIKTGEAGGIQPYDLIVHPITGELWVINGCAGWAKLAPPYDN